MSNVAIILGAGNSTRMKSEKSKLLLQIKGKTVLRRCVETFLAISDIDEIIITAREDDIEEFAAVVPEQQVSFVIGGNSRQQSVKNALDTIDDAQLLIIHDGARMLVEENDISKAIRAAQETKAAAVGVPVKDTIKVIDNNSFVNSTPDRSKLFAVQTPQVFDYNLFCKAMQRAVEENKDFTDDCQLVENIGVKVKMVNGSYTNIKITTPEDIAFAESILSKQGE